MPLVVGWVVLFPIIAFVWTVGITKVFGGTTPPMPEMPKVPGAFPLTHLWFLYQLLLIYVAVHRDSRRRRASRSARRNCAA